MLACFAFGCRTGGGLTAQTCVHARRPPGSPPKTMVTTSWIREPFIWSSPAARAYRPECLTLATVFKLLVVTKCSVCIERASDKHTHTTCIPKLRSNQFAFVAKVAASSPDVRQYLPELCKVSAETGRG